MAGLRSTADASQAFALDANALAGLRKEARESPDQALSKAAGQFEALFMQMVLKQMRETLPKDGPLDSDTMRSYTSMFDQQLAQQLSSRGIGLREALERQLAKRMGLPDSASAPAARSTPAAPPTTTDASMSIRARERIAARPAAHDAVKPAPSAAAAAGPVATNVQAFVDRMRPHAQAAATHLGVPVQLLIAQAGLETGWGKHQPKTPDGAVSHNLFGVKAGKSWTGASVAAATTEFVEGVAVRAVEKFRSYGSYADAFRDVAKLLSGNRYADAIANAADPAAYAKSLQKAGYATDPQYADKLIRAIGMVTSQLSGPAAAAGQPGPVQLVSARGVQETARRADIPYDPVS